MWQSSCKSRHSTPPPYRIHGIVQFVAFVFLWGNSLLWADSKLQIIVKDIQGNPLPGATVLLNSEGETPRELVANPKGEAEYIHLKPGKYRVSVSLEGRQSPPEVEVEVGKEEDQMLEVELIPKIELKQSIDVSAAPESPLEQGASPPSELQRSQIQALPNPPRAIAEVLPMLPGVVRTPDDQIRISGSAEHSSSLTVNTADVTDPATGQFGMSVPVDIVESINVFKTPYVAQYGRFSAGLVSVETRSGGDKWNFEFNDPVPEFRIRGGTIQGVRGFTPRLNFSGPLLAHRLYLSEGLEYRLNKRPVRTLSFPVNETKEEAKNIFTQLDAVLFKDHLLMGSFHWAPWRSQYANLDNFNPQPVTPNLKAGDYTITILDRAVTGGTQWESLLAIKRYQVSVWGQGIEEMFITPTGNRGNYFSQQNRKATRVEWGESVSLKSLEARGTHHFRLGLSLTRTATRGDFLARPVNVTGNDGTLFSRIEFTGGQPFNRSDPEVDFYGQDQWKIYPRAVLNLGFRVERQGITHTFRMAPRIGLAWMPASNQATVFRTGFGLFYNHVPLSVYTFSSYPQQVLTAYNPEGTIETGPALWKNVTEVMPKQRFPVFRGGNSAGNFAPYSATWNVELEHPLTTYLRIRANYLQSSIRGLAIISPQIVEGQKALVLGGAGRSHYRQLEVTSRFSWKERQEFLVSYVRSKSRGDFNDFNRYLGNFPFPLVQPNSFTNTPGDTPNRFLSWGVVNLPFQFTFAPQVEIRTGFPYALRDERQNYVGVPKSDQTRFPLFFSFDARLSRVFKIFFRPQYSVRCSIRGINLTNHFNPLGVHANLADPLSGVFFGYVRRTFIVDLDVIH
jgi:hypothetical protein